ncbi:LEUCINE-RICH REPEAT EXTENSIN-LIKE PROTEIN 4 [Salix koriyanagi]|uniref:Cell wall hydroxyproline-rich glycoprotein n=1 Tax=Salix koriyanagi TaxID=2511006 RepID=A0A9Q0VB77_9ROSI|nr:LEUCINE-RICH REPEAT EXTENSIN-LIKE PROTEIN 4 [Salix koriyanagi]
MLAPGDLQTIHLASNSTTLRLRNAYIALQSWKLAIISDPLSLTSNWEGSDVCNYTGVFCATSLDNSSIQTVAGIDLNHGDMAGHLVEELGLLTDIALFHINSNRFCGKLKYLDLRFNEFEGDLPKELFDKDLDAIFINHNREIGLLKKVTVFDASNNKLFGFSA